MNDVLVTYLQLPLGVRGLVSPTPEGDYRVILNSLLSADEQRRTFDHELRHILENHFSRTEEPLAGLEASARRDDRWQAIIEQVEEQGLPCAPMAPAVLSPKAEASKPLSPKALSPKAESSKLLSSKPQEDPAALAAQAGRGSGASASASLPAKAQSQKPLSPKAESSKPLSPKPQEVPAALAAQGGRVSAASASPAPAGPALQGAPQKPPHARDGAAALLAARRAQLTGLRY